MHIHFKLNLNTNTECVNSLIVAWLKHVSIFKKTSVLEITPSLFCSTLHRVNQPYRQNRIPPLINTHPQLFWHRTDL